MEEGSSRAEGICGEGIENDRLELAAESRACRVCQRTNVGLQRSRLQDFFNPTPYNRSHLLAVASKKYFHEQVEIPAH